MYERKFLLHCRNSPHSMSPPCNLPTIPGVTEPEEKAASEERTIAPSGDAAAQKPKENIAPSEVRSKFRLIIKRSFKSFYIICLTMTVLLQSITILNTMVFEGFVVVRLYVGCMNAGLILV